MYPFYILLKMSTSNIEKFKQFVDHRDDSLELLEFKKGAKWQRRIWSEYLDSPRYPDVLFGSAEELVDFGLKQSLKPGAVITGDTLMVVGSLDEFGLNNSGIDYFIHAIQGFSDGGVVYLNGTFHQVIGRDQEWVFEDPIYQALSEKFGHNFIS